MAIYHLSVKVISRGGGRSATAAAAYRSAEHVRDRTTGQDFDYTRKAGVEHTEILAPEHAPQWVLDRAELWNRVEEAEIRKDAQLAREVEVALPIELDQETQVELIREFAKEAFVSKGMVADIAIHRDNPENPHPCPAHDPDAGRGGVWQEGAGLECEGGVATVAEPVGRDCQPALEGAGARHPDRPSVARGPGARAHCRPEDRGVP
jgi:ATP-dependent exoDNAse (exonuclease V) alpha subunit